MALMSLAIVALVFFTPGIGIGPEVQQYFSNLYIGLPWLSFVGRLPMLSAVALLFVVIMCWGGFWGILLLIEHFLVVNAKAWTLLDGSELFIQRPYIIIRLPQYIARMVIVFLGVYLIFQMGLILVQNFFTMLSPYLGELYRPSLEVNTLILAFLILIAYWGWILELQFRRRWMLEAYQQVRRVRSGVFIPPYQR